MSLNQLKSKLENAGFQTVEIKEGELGFGTVINDNGEWTNLRISLCAKKSNNGYEVHFVSKLEPPKTFSTVNKLVKFAKEFYSI